MNSIICTFLFLLCTHSSDQLGGLNCVQEDPHNKPGQIYYFRENYLSTIPGNEDQDNSEDEDEVLGWVCQMILHHPVGIC